MQVDGPVATGRGVHPSCGSERGEDKDECGRQRMEDGVRQERVSSAQLWVRPFPSG